MYTHVLHVCFGLLFFLAGESQVNGGRREGAGHGEVCSGRM